MSVKRFILSFLFLLQSISLSFADDNKIVSVLSDAWFPLNGNPSSAYPGFGIEILQQMLKQEGMELNYQLASWGRSLIETAEGNADCVIGAGMDEGEGLLFANFPIYRMQNDYFVASNSEWQFNGYSSLNGLRVALVKDYTYGKVINKYIKEYPEMVIISGGGDPLQKNINLLINHRVDVLVEDRQVMQSKIAGNPLAANIKFAGIEESDVVYLACGKDSVAGRKMIAIYNKQFPKLKESDAFKKILKRYGLEPEIIFQKN